MNTGPDIRFSGRVVVVSPHLDDAIMSVGATIAKAVQDGAQLDVLTVFGYEPQSAAAAGSWDRKSGFETEGQAAQARRAEDREACLALGAEPRWLSFGAEPYERHGSEEEIWSAVEAATRGADLVLLPGYPLEHPDHAELSELLLRRGLSCRMIALYAEQPYSFYHSKTQPGSTIVPALQPVLGNSLAWTHVATNSKHRRTKLQAIRAYRSQLRSLGLGYLRLHHLLWREAAQGGESIAWLPRSPRKDPSMSRISIKSQVHAHQVE